MKFQKTILLLSVLALSTKFSSILSKEIQTKAEYEKIIKGPGLKVIKFYANWCGACKLMKPTFDRISRKHAKKAGFYEINLDNKQLKEIVRKNEVRAIPTTIFIKNGNIIAKERGAMNEQDLEKKVIELTKS